MKIPAIKGKIGTTVFYSSQMTFGDIAEYVSPITEELHKNKTLSDMIQRSLTNNVDNIVEYLKQQPDRFFNSLVLAVYDGNPQWHELEIDYITEPQKKYSNLGFLEFSGNEKIFPVDGQHRVEAIKKAIKEDSSLAAETIGVLFIGHRVIPDGIAKTRRIFSTLNRYAKPVSMSDIVALDEDDIVAISTRNLLESHPLFVDERVSIGLTKAIPNNDSKCFTTIITLSECNRHLLECYLRHPSQDTVKNFVRVRPCDETIQEFYAYICDIWNEITKMPDVKKFLSNKVAIRNSSTGGNLLFRPIGLLPFIEACKRLNKLSPQTNVKDIISQFRHFDFSVNNALWQDILWDDSRKIMLMNNKSLTRRIFMYIYNKQSLKSNELNKLKTEFNACKKMDDAFTTLDAFTFSGEL